MNRVDVRKTYKMLIGGAMARSESGRVYQVDGINIPLGSRKDLRDAVRAAGAAWPGWTGKTAMLRGQILYRCAEMLESRRDEFADLLGEEGGTEVDEAIETFVWYAGWTDKLAQTVGTVNPVAGPYFNFTIPESSGVVGIIAPAPALLGPVRRLAPALCAGNTVVAILDPAQPLPGLVLGEVLSTSDLPSGVVNLLSGKAEEMGPHLAAHMAVNALDLSGCPAGLRAQLEELAGTNLKRIFGTPGEIVLSPDVITASMEMKTVWHPMGA